MSKSEILAPVKIKVQFHVIDYENGHSKFEVVEMIIPESVQLNLFKTAIEDKQKYLDEYIVEMDKSQMILDWSFVMNKDSVKAFFMVYGSDKNFLANLDVCYSYMEDSISHLNPAEQVKIILAAFNFGLAGIKTTVDDFQSSLKGKSKERDKNTESKDRDIDLLYGCG